MFFQRCSHSKVQFFIVLFYFVAMQADPNQSSVQPEQSSASSISGIGKASHLQKLAQIYTPIVQSYEQQKKSNMQFPDRSKPEDAYAQRVAGRLQAVTASQQEITSHSLLQRSYQLSPQARGFMMANNMNYAAFDGNVSVTSFQDCLTKEIIGIVERSATAGMLSDYQSPQRQLARYNCHLAITAQQLNQSSRVEQAVAVTDLSHFFELYGNAMLQDDGSGDAQAIMAMGQGAARDVYKLHEFLKKLGHNPNQTIKEVANNCYAIGATMCNIAATAYEFTPLAYLKDLNDVMTKQTHPSSLGQNIDPVDMHKVIQDRIDHNLQTLQTGYVQSLHAAKLIVQKMMKKSAQENIADITEIAVDGWITDKATHLLGKMCTMIGDTALQAADQLTQQIPSSLQDSTFRAVQTSAGQLELFADISGESIAAASAAQIATNNAEKIATSMAKSARAVEKIA